MFGKNYDKELGNLAYTVAKQGRTIKEQRELIDALMKQNADIYKSLWNSNYRFSKLLEALQLEWSDNRLISTRKKKSA